MPDRERAHACEECGAPLDLQQRYCVSCGTRNRNAPGPAADYFARPGRRGRALAAAAAPVPPRRGWLASNSSALLLALLPAAVAAGVLVGKSGGGSDQQLIDALKNQRPAATAAAPAAAAAGGASTAAKASSSKKAHSAKTRSGRTLSKTKFGSAHQVTGSKPTAKKVQSDTNLVKKLQQETGKGYLHQQTDLPDTVVVGK
ncbi:MAG TPA: hypothetical protein VGI67_17225 [Thermoleophilaceae bacterium]|jgi:hypothetical protein